MDDIVVIILTIIIMVAGALSQAKKRNRQAPLDQNHPAGPDPSIWDFLDNPKPESSKLIDQPLPQTTNEPIRYRRFENEPPVQIDHSNDSIQTNIYSDDRSLESVSENLENQSRSQIIENRAAKMKEIIIEDHKNKLAEEFSLKKAVVFSEIIQRKYI